MRLRAPRVVRPVDHGVRPDPGVRARSARAGPITAYGLDRARRAASSAPRRHHGGRVDARPAAARRPELDLGDHRRRRAPRSPGSARAGRRRSAVTSSAQRVAGQDRPPEARLLARRGARQARRPRASRRAELHERLAQHDAGQHRDARGSGPRSTARWRSRSFVADARARRARPRSTRSTQGDTGSPRPCARPGSGSCAMGVHYSLSRVRVPLRTLGL